MEENKNKLTRWEYTFTPFYLHYVNENEKKEQEEKFNQLGREGWEAYGVSNWDGYSKWILLKRPIIESSERG